MRIALVYHSAGGNTKALADVILLGFPFEIDVFQMKEFDVSTLENYDGLIVGSYTWGDGDLPARAKRFYQALEQVDLSHLKTAIFGTGETNYRMFCGAVDKFTSLLNEKSDLLVTLKVEQLYQYTDLERIQRFCNIFMSKSALLKTN